MPIVHLRRRGRLRVRSVVPPWIPRNSVPPLSLPLNPVLVLPLAREPGMPVRGRATPVAIPRRSPPRNSAARAQGSWPQPSSTRTMSPVSPPELTPVASAVGARPVVMMTVHVAAQSKSASRSSSCLMASHAMPTSAAWPAEVSVSNATARAAARAARPMRSSVYAACTIAMRPPNTTTSTAIAIADSTATPPRSTRKNVAIRGRAGSRHGTWSQPGYSVGRVRACGSKSETPGATSSPFGAPRTPIPMNVLANILNRCYSIYCEWRATNDQVGFLKQGNISQWWRQKC